MLKKIISAMLALTLALSLAGVVCASGGPEQGIERVQVLEEAVPAGTVPMAQASGNYFIPYDWTYGQSVVVGQSMFLRGSGQRCGPHRRLPGGAHLPGDI